MANYTAADVKRLRELTGSGMMACKNALADADGDFDKAVEQLRIKGAKDVGKRAERTTAEGLVVAKDGVMIEINCETDFVAKNDEFIKLADEIVTVAAAGKPADLDALKALELDGKTIDTVIAEQSAKIGEKLELSRVASFDGPVAVYLHKRSSNSTCRPLSAFSSSTPVKAMLLLRPLAALQCRSQHSRRSTSRVTRFPRRSSLPSVTSPKRPPAQKASPSRHCRRSSKAASTVTSRTSF